jgi:hypothetical protein
MRVKIKYAVSSMQDELESDQQLYRKRPVLSDFSTFEDWTSMGYIIY